MHAEKEYGADNPYLTYQLFNVERPAAGQGLHLRTYDIAIAANVVACHQKYPENFKDGKSRIEKGRFRRLLMNWAGIRRLHMLHSAY